jgi:glycosyltransferase involved in cell wall biosynthesis
MYDGLVTHRLITRVDGFIALTDAGCQELVAMGAAAESTTVIPNGVAAEDVDLAAGDGLENLQPAGLDAPYALFTGRLDQNKNVKFLVQQAEQFAARGLRLEIVGPDGGEGAQVRAAAAERDAINVRGPVSQRLRNLMLHGSALLVLPSGAEGLPTSALEALFCGVPVVASATSGNEALADSFGEGVSLFRPDTPTTLGTALDLALALSPATRLAIQRRARSMYSWDRLSERIEGVYRRAVEASPRPR